MLRNMQLETTCRSSSHRLFGWWSLVLTHTHTRYPPFARLYLCGRGVPKQIGVLGWITPTTGETARDVGGLKFTPIVPSVKACLAILKQDHPDLDYIIGLSHSGEKKNPGAAGG